MKAVAVVFCVCLAVLVLLMVFACVLTLIFELYTYVMERVSELKNEGVL